MNRVRLIMVLAVSVLAMGAALLLLLDDTRRWEERGATALKQMATASVLYNEGFGAAPPNAFTLVWSNYFTPETAVLPGSDTVAADVRFFGRSANDLWAMDAEAAQALLSRSPERTGGWECFGDFFLTPEFWQEGGGSSPDRRLILAVSIGYGNPPRRVVYSPGCSTAVVADPGWLDEQNDLRATMGFASLELPAR
ncbi:MAG: hypothetical protein HKN62_16365 [Phycisphaerales bacterium]|nr:hypothetical protein [Phycisphaerales bacterium]